MTTLSRSVGKRPIESRAFRLAAANSTDRAIFKASKEESRRVIEAEQPIKSYMSLPASQYSVLDARKIERIDDSSFRCYVGQLNIFQWSAEPVLTVSVEPEVEAGGCTIRLISCQLKGSKFVEDINDKFEASMTNIVRWREIQATSNEEDPQLAASSSSGKEIVSSTTLEVQIEVPNWMSFISTNRISSAGSSVLQNLLNLMVPRFLVQLESDYLAWSRGDRRTSQVSTETTS